MFFLCQSERWAVTRRDPLPSPAWQLNSNGRSAELMEIPADVRAALNGQVCPLPPLPYLSVPLLLSQLTDSFKIRIHHSLKHLPQVDYSVFKNHKSLNTLSVSTLLYKKKSQVIRFLALRAPWVRRNHTASVVASLDVADNCNYVYSPDSDFLAYFLLCPLIMRMKTSSRMKMSPTKATTTRNHHSS